MEKSVIKLLALFALFQLAQPYSRAAELTVLSSTNWEEFVPRGKEVDAIYGDFVLRNERLVAVIAFPREGRNANMMTKGVGGALIDLTESPLQSDQLTAFYPGDPIPAFEFVGVEVDGNRVEQIEDLNRLYLTGTSVVLLLQSRDSTDLPRTELIYRLDNNREFIEVETRFVNPSLSRQEVSLMDSVRVDDSRDGLAVEKAPKGATTLFWAYDKWFGQAYGVLATGNEMSVTTGEGARSPSMLEYLLEGKSQITLNPGESYTLKRRIFPAANLLQLKSKVASSLSIPLTRVRIRVFDSVETPVAGADIEVFLDGQPFASGRSSEDGNLEFGLPVGRAFARISALGRGSTSIILNPSQPEVHTAILEQPGSVTTLIRDESGGQIPCKVQFFGRYGTPDPFFGPDSGERAIHNVIYSPTGEFEQILEPGLYDVIISHGPEYDAVFTSLEVVAGSPSRLEATLRRTVDTAGWVSSDFHSHSSPSGDNTSSQLGRVLNLLTEHIEFAPCTEHNRVSTYTPHLRALAAESLMATCTGIELTSRPGGLNHHNAFPLDRKPHHQDNGAPLPSSEPEIQIERLALWDNESDKLVQQNHPDMETLFFDRDGDGKRDSAYSRMFGYMDVIEVHPPEAVTWRPFTARTRPGANPGDPRGNRIFSWLKTFNTGHRIPGVVNTDAHANFHGSGWLRNYIKSPTDNPAEIQTLDIVHAAERGNLIMTNGPFLEVWLRASQSGTSSEGTAGDDIRAPGGKVLLRVRVQCPNWFDIDRIQVLLNGRLARHLNFTRRTHPNLFSDAEVKFDDEIELDLSGDTHVVITAVGEHSSLGPVVGPSHQSDKPVAISNPIFVDVDGQGFEPNGDILEDMGSAIP